MFRACGFAGFGKGEELDRGLGEVLRLRFGLLRCGLGLGWRREGRADERSESVDRACSNDRVRGLGA